MSQFLTREDCDLILDALYFAEKAFRKYRDYPSHKFKQQQIKRVLDIKEKIKILKLEVKINERSTNENHPANCL